MLKRLAVAAVGLAVLLALGAGTALVPARQLWDQLTGNDDPGQVRVVRWIDGDTVVTDAGTVRLVGIDTPERGRCGYLRARNVSERAAPVGSKVSLIRVGDAEKDRYDRLLRYVDTGRADVGAVQITAGAWARYDSRDGYPRHPNQREYRLMDAESRNYCGTPHP